MSLEMHPLLDHLSIFTLNDLLESEEKTISFFQDLDLIPKKDNKSAPTCLKCGSPMFCSASKDKKLGWRWRCSKYTARVSPCQNVLSPLKNTFFENTNLSIRDSVAMIIGFVLEIGITELQKHICDWRHRRNEKDSPSSIKELGFYVIKNHYDKLKNICETVVSRDSDLKKGTAKNKSLFDRYKTKRLSGLPKFGQKVYALLMDVKSLFPCLGKKEVIPNPVDKDVASSTHEEMDSDNSLSIVLTSVYTAENETVSETTDSSLVDENIDVRNVSKKISVEPGNSSSLDDCSTYNENVQSLEVENSNLLNQSFKDVDSPSLDHEDSNSTNVPSKDVDLSTLEPENMNIVVFYSDDIDSSSVKPNTEKSFINSTDKNESSLSPEKTQISSAGLENTSLAEEMDNSSANPKENRQQDVSSTPNKKDIPARNMAKCTVSSTSSIKVNISDSNKDVFVTSTADSLNEIIVISERPTSPMRRFKRKKT